MTAKKRLFVSAEETATSEAQTLRVLEFIAHYLDRIDDHLERLAAQVESGQAGGARIVQGLEQITKALRSKT
ncbi:MAG TPA: hypothetical protein VGP50_10460 [Stellaceae bacterium]|jgi:hypothetical protein|nr:hypothetical protein [Stellaceae bacterium]